MAVDYTKFSPNGPIPDNSATNYEWWALKGDELASSVNGIVDFLARNQSARQNQYMVNARLYGSLNSMGFNGLNFSKLSLSRSGIKDRLTYNVVQSAIDTVTSKMAKNKPKSLFLTSGGNYKLQRRAKKLTKFCDGVRYENHGYKAGRIAFRDGCIFGSGLIHPFAWYGRVAWERVFPWEIFVDDVDSIYGKPRTLHRVKAVDREVVAKWVSTFAPKQAATVRRCNPMPTNGKQNFPNVADQILVRESWHLHSGPDSDDGLRAVSIDNGTLLAEEYTKSYFPFAKFDWGDPVFGWWGQSAVEQVQDIQLEINKLLFLAQRSFHLAGTFKILIESGSKVVKEHFNNDVGALINYTGKEPQYIIPPVLPPEFLTHLWNLKNAAFERLGVSQLSAASKKPDGLNSGKALREFNDIESDRFMTVGQAYEEFHMDLDRISIGVAKDIAEEEGDYKVRSVQKGFIEEISWKDIDLEEDDYVMKAYAVSSLPDDPMDRLETVQEYMQAGIYNLRTGKRLLDSPDLEQIDDLQDAKENYLHMVLEKIVEDGEYTAPEPQDDLALAKELVLDYYAQGKVNGLESEKLDMLLEFSDAVDALNNQAQAAAMAAQQASQMGQPQAVPQAPPTSNLIPNAPGAAA